MSHSANALLPTSSSPRNMMTTLENAISRRAASSASAVSPDTVAYGDQPTTSSVNRVPGSTEAPPTSASSAFNSTSLRDSLIAAPVLSSRSFDVLGNPTCVQDPRIFALAAANSSSVSAPEVVQLCEVFDLVGRVRRRRRILRGRSGGGAYCACLGLVGRRLRRRPAAAPARSSCPRGERSPLQRRAPGVLSVA